MNRMLATVIVIASFSGVGQAATELASPCRADAIGDRKLREHQFVPIGGIEQWITIDGAACANPVILVVHGGPGNPISPFVDELFGAWQETFTIATWDQRLSGRTYGRNEPVTELTEERLEQTTLTIEQLVADGLEVAQYLQARLGHRKLILHGSSWGSVLAVHMAHQRPDLFHAYVGVSQLVDYDRNIADSYRATLERARLGDDQESIRTLESLGAPPWSSPRNFGRLRRIIRAYESARTTPGPEFDVTAAYSSEADRAAYFAGEELSFIKFVGLKGNGMASQVDLPALGTRFELPLYVLQGEEDLLTRTAVTREWFDALQAPRKKLVLVEGAGHDPNFAMLDAQFRLLKDEVAPQAR